MNGKELPEMEFVEIEVGDKVVLKAEGDTVRGTVASLNAEILVVDDTKQQRRKGSKCARSTVAVKWDEIKTGRVKIEHLGKS